MGLYSPQLSLEKYHVSNTVLTASDLSIPRTNASDAVKQSGENVHKMNKSDPSPSPTESTCSVSSSGSKGTKRKLNRSTSTQCDGIIPMQSTKKRRMDCEEYLVSSHDEETPPIQKLKLLVHNVSHADLCMTLQPDCVHGINPDSELMARPRSSRYKVMCHCWIVRYVCEEIATAMKKGAKYSGIAFKDKQSQSRYVGFLFNPPARICSWSDFRLRNPDSKTISKSLSVFVVRVFFPLISVLLPKWIALHQPTPPVSSPSTTDTITFSPLNGLPIPSHTVSKYQLNGDHHKDHSETALHHKLRKEAITSSGNQSTRKCCNDDDCIQETVSIKARNPNSKSKMDDISRSNLNASDELIYKLFLVSGAGHPLKTESAYYEDDSTQHLSRLMCRFIRDFYPQIEVTQYYSKQDIFQYAENIKFVHSTLRPAIDTERSALAMLHGKYWKRYFNLSITLCDGTPARLSAIIEGLRSFEPDMLHMYRRKSLWADYPHVDKLWDEDMEYLKFAQMETYPAIPVNDIHDEAVLNMIREMEKWKTDFLRKAVDNAQSEMSRFWLRKTRQPVLAVLAVQKPEETEPTYYRGVNVEVSMPTGSLCAERNAIGAAIAADPSLRREDFKMVAVLFMAELDEKPITPRFSSMSGPGAVSPKMRAFHPQRETPTTFMSLLTPSRSAPELAQRVSFFWRERSKRYKSAWTMWIVYGMAEENCSM